MKLRGEQLWHAMVGVEKAKLRASQFLAADDLVECPDCYCVMEAYDDRNIPLYIRHDCDPYGTKASKNLQRAGRRGEGK